MELRRDFKYSQNQEELIGVPSFTTTPYGVRATSQSLTSPISPSRSSSAGTTTSQSDWLCRVVPAAQTPIGPSTTVITRPSATSASLSQKNKACVLSGKQFTSSLNHHSARTHSLGLHRDPSSARHSTPTPRGQHRSASPRRHSKLQACVASPQSPQSYSWVGRATRL